MGDAGAVQQLPRLLGIDHQRLALLHPMLRSADEDRGGGRDDLTDTQPVKAHPQSPAAASARLHCRRSRAPVSMTPAASLSDRMTAEPFPRVAPCVQLRA